MKRRKQKHLTEDEVERLKAACETFSDQLIVYGILYTGMRVDFRAHPCKMRIEIFSTGSLFVYQDYL